MDSFYSEDELAQLNIKVGTNVKISKKCSIYSDDIELGSNVRIDDFCILSGKIRIGDYVHIAAYSALYGGAEGIYLDDFASISSRVTIYSVCDDYSGETLTNPIVPDEYKNVDSRPVKICKHVIIGSNSVVLPGVILHEGSAFGSFSLVKMDSEAWSINAGIPANKIKARSKNLLGGGKTADVTKTLTVLHSFADSNIITKPLSSIHQGFDVRRSEWKVSLQ